MLSDNNAHKIRKVPLYTCKKTNKEIRQGKQCFSFLFRLIHFSVLTLAPCTSLHLFQTSFVLIVKSDCYRPSSFLGSVCLYSTPSRLSQTLLSQNKAFVAYSMRKCLLKYRVWIMTLLSPPFLRAAKSVLYSHSNCLCCPWFTKCLLKEVNSLYRIYSVI